MELTVVSPEGEEAREGGVLAALFAAGLARYHVRKPLWAPARLEAWLAAWPPEARRRMVLHQHHELAARLAVGGRHWRDDGAAPARPTGGGFTSRSCHDLATLAAALGRYDAVLFGPVFPSISKPGHGAGRAVAEVAAGLQRARAVLEARHGRARRTSVLALGGVTAASVGRCREAGFDGVAVLGAVWSAADPLGAFAELRDRVR